MSEKNHRLAAYGCPMPLDDALRVIMGVPATPAPKPEPDYEQHPGLKVAAMMRAEARRLLKLARDIERVEKSLDG